MRVSVDVDDVDDVDMDSGDISVDPLTVAPENRVNETVPDEAGTVRNGQYLDEDRKHKVYDARGQNGTVHTVRRRGRSRIWKIFPRRFFTTVLT
jgi:hypothetical protein